LKRENDPPKKYPVERAVLARSCLVLRLDVPGE
jgi:hypothetical protein